MKPAITVSSLDLERLENLNVSSNPAEQATHLALLDELARADVVAPGQIAPDVVTMNSTVRFQIEELDEQFCLTLSYPKDIGKVQDAISVLTPVGTALLGLSAGDTIDWPRRDGQLQSVRLLEVLYQPERAGDYFR